VQKSDFLEVLTLIDPILELGVLSLNDIYLKVLIDIVDKEAHVLSQLHNLSEDLPGV